MNSLTFQWREIKWREKIERKNGEKKNIEVQTCSKNFNNFMKFQLIFQVDLLCEEEEIKSQLVEIFLKLKKNDEPGSIKK